MIIWLTGQPGAGKTTIAKEVKYLLEARWNRDVVIVDGDELRKIFPNTGFSKEERHKNVLRAQEIARFLHSKGFTPVVSLVSPYRDIREEFKAQGNVLEVYVHTTELRGREKYHVADYEPPLENFVDLDTTNKEVYKSAEIIIKKYIKGLGHG